MRRHQDCFCLALSSILMGSAIVSATDFASANLSLLSTDHASITQNNLSEEIDLSQAANKRVNQHLDNSQITETSGKQSKEQQEVLMVTLNSPPKDVHHYEDPELGYYITEYLIEGDNIENWERLFTIQNFALRPELGSPREFYDTLVEFREEECPGTTSWNIIQQNEHSILYEWQSTACLGWPEQHEISRIIDGNFNRFRVAYTAKVDVLSPEERQEWLDRLSEAHIEVRP